MDKQDEGEAIPVRRPEPSPPKQSENDIYEAASRSTADYATFEASANTSHKKAKELRPKKSKKVLFIILVVLFLLTAASGGAYWYLQNHKSKIPDQPSSSQASATKEPEAATVQDSGDLSLKHYASTAKKLNLEFDYPGKWQVTPPAAETATSDKPIVLSSPSTSIKNVSGASVTGKVTIQIRPRGPSIKELESGSATAAQDSVQIAYAHPTSGQYQYPFLSFIRLTGGANPSAAFEEVIITSTQEYKKSSPINPISLGSIDPLVSANFNTCKASDCAATLSVTNDTWQNTEVFKQTLAIFQSLQIK